MRLFAWLIDIVFKHIYLKVPPPDYWQTNKWKSGQGFGKSEPVTRKQCKVCKRTIWTNNPKSICGSLQCWLKGV